MENSIIDLVSIIKKLKKSKIPIGHISKMKDMDVSQNLNSDV